MKITVINKDGTVVGVIANATEVKACEDGRFLIKHLVECECCHSQAPYVYQIPKGYYITQAEGLGSSSTEKLKGWPEHGGKEI